MAKNPHPYICDECQTPKKPSNGWFLLHSMGGCIQVFPWEDSAAERDDIKHLCGIGCVLKVTGRELVKVYDTPEGQ